MIQTFLFSLISVLILFWLPGYVTGQRIFKEQEIKKLKMSLIERVFFQILASILIVGLIALTLALLGQFIIWYLLGLVLIYSFVFTVIFKVKFTLPKFSTLKFDTEFRFLVLLIILTAILFLHPFQFDIFHFREGGNNINIGIFLAKEGSFFAKDSLYNSIPSEFRNTFYSIDKDGIASLFPTHPFLIDTEGFIKPTYYAFYPIWIAIAYIIGGLNGALFLNPLFSILSVLALYFLSKRLINQRVAMLTTVFLTISFLQIYTAWYHGNEIMFQMVTFMFILLFLYFLETKNKFLATLSAVSLLELLMIRPEAFIMLLPGLFIFGVLSNHYTKKGLKIFILSFLIFTPLLFDYSSKFYPFIVKNVLNLDLLPKYKNLFEVLFFNIGNNLVFYIFISFFAILLSFVLYLIIHYWRNLIILLKNYYRHLLLFSLLTFLFYGIWKYPSDPEYKNLHNLIAISWYTGRVAIVLAVCGFILFIKNAENEKFKFIACLYLPYFIFFIEEIRNFVLHPWCMRRYMSFVFPFLLVYLAYFVFKIPTIFKLSPTLKRIVLASFVLIIIVSFVGPNALLAEMLQKNQSLPSVIRQTEEINNYFPENSIIIFHVDSYELTPAMPLKFIWDRNTVLLERKLKYGPLPRRVRVMDEEKIVEDDYLMSNYVRMCEIWLQGGFSVYVINPSNKFLSKTLNNKNIELSLDKKLGLNFYLIDMQYNKFPTALFEYKKDLDVYKIGIKEEASSI